MLNKILFFVFCLLVIQFGSYGQMKFGLKAGVPFNIQNLEIKNAKIETTRPFNLGLTSECMFPVPKIGFEVSALYELEKITGKDLQEEVNISYLIIPVNFKYKFGFSLFRFMLFAGPSIEIMLYNSGDIVLNELDFHTLDPTKIRFAPENFNWGINAGFGIECLKMQASVAFFYNFKTPIKRIDDIYYQTASEDDINSKQNGLVLSLAWFF